MGTQVSYAQSRSTVIVNSPDHTLSVAFSISSNSQASYTIRYANEVIMPTAALGLVREDGDFSTGIRLVSASKPEVVTDSYVMRHGKRKQITYRANQQVVQLVNRAGQRMDILFRVSNDGVGFRYYFPEQSTDRKKIVLEETSFRFRPGTRSWIQPCPEPKSGWQQTQPSYEENYRQNSLLSELPDSVSSWVYPALFRTGKHWVLLSETAPDRNYCGTRLKHLRQGDAFTVALADPRETFTGGNAQPESFLPWATPWRLILVSDNLGTIVESTLGTDLAKPEIAGNFSFVKPGRSAWSWAMYGDDSTVYSAQRTFIDYAAQMGWEYSLIDANWDRQIGYDKLADLVTYARTKGVGLWVWYNSAGTWNTVPHTPKDVLVSVDRRRRELARLKSIGVQGIKVDFFGGDGQSMMAYYQDIAEDAASSGLMVNFHGCTLPRGWQRTYPNLMTMEAVRGYENVTFAQENADRQPMQCALLPFTRNVFDPMDYTPVVFSEDPDIKRRTTNAFELALPFLFTSGIQHFSEVATGMAGVPDYVQGLMRDVPVAWDESRFVEGYPGKLVVIARRVGNVWYVAGINGEAVNKSLQLSLPFVKASTGILVTDGEGARTFTTRTVTKATSRSFSLPLHAYGGFVLKLIL
ncbi:glycoside hydrolase family 97 protein [Spirosoma panaciterrae]|uniref:glycoside hydrolase family 97 protein n=1 Tax=Spirosoma panaciterrae TaxID=496058 RepID=UPI0006840461|nr:glycoside hydrolase family 97 protein [Spirosoma panaciterrae]